MNDDLVKRLRAALEPFAKQDMGICKYCNGSGESVADQICPVCEGDGADRADLNNNGEASDGSA